MTEQAVTEAFTNGDRKYARVSGWELWPRRRSLDGKTWLCRWCAKPLSSGCTSYCSSDCSNEISIRASIPGVRRFAVERANGKCEGCGVNFKDLEAAFKYYDLWYERHIPHSQRPKYIYKLRRYEESWIPDPRQFRAAAGFGGHYHLWEVNHVKAIAEGGDPCDPANWEVLCLPCHKAHTKALAGRLAKARKKK